MAGGSRRDTTSDIHPCLELGEPLLGDGDVGCGNRAAVFFDGVQQHKQVPGSPIENAKEPPAIVAAKLAKLSFDLR